MVDRRRVRDSTKHKPDLTIDGDLKCDQRVDGEVQPSRLGPSGDGSGGTYPGSQGVRDIAESS